MAKQKRTEENKTVKERTEEEKVFQIPLEVTLGGKVYKIRPLVIKESREWRKKCNKLMSGLSEPTRAKGKTKDIENYQEAISTLMVIMPDQIIDLFFAYAKELPREEIEGKATEAELDQAFLEVLPLAFPLTANLGKMLEKIGH